MQMGSLGNENRDLQGSPLGVRERLGREVQRRNTGALRRPGPSPSPCPRDPREHAAETDCHGSCLFPHVVQFRQKQTPS